MSYVPPRPPPPLTEPLTPEQIERARRQQLELLSCMHPIPNRWIEWWARRRLAREARR